MKGQKLLDFIGKNVAQTLSHKKVPIESKTEIIAAAPKVKGTHIVPSNVFIVISFKKSIPFDARLIKQSLMSSAQGSLKYKKIPYKIVSVEFSAIPCSPELQAQGIEKKIDYACVKKVKLGYKPLKESISLETASMALGRIYGIAIKEMWEIVEGNHLFSGAIKVGTAGYSGITNMTFNVKAIKRPMEEEDESEAPVGKKNKKNKKTFFIDYEISLDKNSAREFMKEHLITLTHGLELAAWSELYSTFTHYIPKDTKFGNIYYKRGIRKDMKDRVLVVVYKEVPPERGREYEEVGKKMETDDQGQKQSHTQTETKTSSSYGTGIFPLVKNVDFKKGLKFFEVKPIGSKLYAEVTCYTKDSKEFKILFSAFRMSPSILGAASALQDLKEQNDKATTKLDKAVAAKAILSFFDSYYPMLTPIEKKIQRFRKDLFDDFQVQTPGTDDHRKREIPSPVLDSIASEIRNALEREQKVVRDMEQRAKKLPDKKTIMKEIQSLVQKVAKRKLWNVNVYPMGSDPFWKMSGEVVNDIAEQTALLGKVAETWTERNVPVPVFRQEFYRDAIPIMQKIKEASIIDAPEIAEKVGTYAEKLLHSDKPQTVEAMKNLVHRFDIFVNDLSKQVLAILKKKYRKETGKAEYALVSKKDPSKVLEWYGAKKPSKEKVELSERRVQWFKNKGK